jgi:hypothetical protein
MVSSVLAESPAMLDERLLQGYLDHVIVALLPALPKFRSGR